jgi:methylmalonyl-CoA epimerase
VGGTPASPGEYPAQAFLELDGGAGFCGGTLIESTLLLTAAHCVTDFGEVLTEGRLRVGLGHVARNQISDFYGVAGVDVHSGYDPFTSNGNDLALVRLDRPAPYAPLRVIRTDESAKWTPPATATIIGWGVTESGEPSNELLEATADDSPIAKYVGTRGPGLHHITLRVDDIVAALAQLRARGVRLIDEFPRPGAHGSLVAFIHPSSAHGVLVELKQKASEV